MAMAAPKSQQGALVTKAIDQLNISVKKNENAKNMNNLAVAQTLNGEYVDAKVTATKALSLAKKDKVTKKIKSNLAPQHIRDGEYEEAIVMLGASTLSSTSTFNMGLAHLLKKDFDAAKTNLDNATKDNGSANAYYAAAITASRSGDESTMAARLKKSIEMNADLRARAIDDLEFKKYWEAESFKGAIK